MAMAGAAADPAFEAHWKEYIGSLFAAAEVNKVVNNSIRIANYYQKLDQVFDDGLTKKKAGKLSGAFVTLLMYCNLYVTLAKHNAFNIKQYERDKSKAKRCKDKIMTTLETWQPVLKEQQRAVFHSMGAPSAPAVGVEPLDMGRVTADLASLSALNALMAPSAPPAVPVATRGAGPRLVKVFGDGHCMYRSFACAVMPDVARLPRNEFGIILNQDSRQVEEAAALSLRARLATYMESHWEEFPTVLTEERAMRAAGIRGSTWGGEEEIVAMGRLLRRDVAVHQLRGGAESQHTYRYEGGSASGAMIHLRYTRNEERAMLTGDPEAGGHYELLLF